MFPYCKLCVFFLAVTGCVDKPSVSPPTLPFEAEWVSVDVSGRSLYIGEKRWCVYEREPSRLTIEGKLGVPDQPNSSSALTVTLLSAQTLKEGSWREIEGYAGKQVSLRREGDLLRVQSADFSESKLNGLYKYGSDLAPKKGPSIYEWGRYEFAESRH